MKRYDKLLFVDVQNTCVSPIAEAIMQNRFLLEDILIESRGLVVLFPEPVNLKTEEVLQLAGLTGAGLVSAPLEESDFDERTLILTMTMEQQEKIYSEFKNPINVFALRAYIGADDDVYDPYGGTLEDYQKCYDQLNFMLDRLSELLLQEEKTYV